MKSLYTHLWNECSTMVIFKMRWGVQDLGKVNLLKNQVNMAQTKTKRENADYKK